MKSPSQRKRVTALSCKVDGRTLYHTGTPVHLLCFGVIKKRMCDSKFNASVFFGVLLLPLTD